MTMRLGEYPQLIKVSGATYIAVPREFVVSNGLRIHDRLHCEIRGTQIVLEVPKHD